MYLLVAVVYESRSRISAEAGTVPPFFPMSAGGMSVALAEPMAKSRRKDYEAPPPAGGTTAVNMEPDRVAQRAYELYLARGGGDGRAMDDWLRAEHELRSSPARKPETS